MPKNISSVDYFLEHVPGGGSPLFDKALREHGKLPSDIVPVCTEREQRARMLEARIAMLALDPEIELTK